VLLDRNGGFRAIERVQFAYSSRSSSSRWRVYTGFVADIPKVPKPQIDAVLAALLKVPPMPMAGISPNKAKAKAKPQAKKRSKPHWML
jgi:hypothetical protein